MSFSEVLIRSAESADAEALLKLNNAFNGCGSSSLQRIVDCLHSSNELVFVAQYQDELIGFCCVQILRSFCYNVDYAEITELYVEQPFRRQGVGTALMQHVHQHLHTQNIWSFQLFTGADNRFAQAFYEKHGYRKSSEILYRKRGNN